MHHNLFEDASEHTRKVDLCVEVEVLVHGVESVGQTKDVDVHINVYLVRDFAGYLAHGARRSCVTGHRCFCRIQLGITAQLYTLNQTRLASRQCMNHAGKPVPRNLE